MDREMACIFGFLFVFLIVTGYLFWSNLVVETWWNTTGNYSIVQGRLPLAYFNIEGSISGFMFFGFGGISGYISGGTENTVVCFYRDGRTLKTYECAMKNARLIHYIGDPVILRYEKFGRTTRGKIIKLDPKCHCCLYEDPFVEVWFNMDEVIGNVTGDMKWQWDKE